jgi:hypothetical protein
MPSDERKYFLKNQTYEKFTKILIKVIDLWAIYLHIMTSFLSFSWIINSICNVLITFIHYAIFNF